MITRCLVLLRSPSALVIRRIADSAALHTTSRCGGGVISPPLSLTAISEGVEAISESTSVYFRSSRQLSQLTLIVRSMNPAENR